jgi:hypothetical protein
MQTKEFHNHIQIWVPAKVLRYTTLKSTMDNHLPFMTFLPHALVLQLCQKFAHVEPPHPNPFPIAFPFPGLLTLFQHNRVFGCEDICPTSKLQTGGSGYFFMSGTSLKTCAPSMVIPTARLQAEWLSSLLVHANYLVPLNKPSKKRRYQSGRLIGLY